MTTRSVLLGACLSVCACFPRSAPPPTGLTPSQVSLAEFKKDPALTEALLESGRQVFVAECGECHGHPDLTAFSQAKWPRALEQMTDKANLDPAKSAQVTAFVLTAAEAANAPK